MLSIEEKKPSLEEIFAHYTARMDALLQEGEAMNRRLEIQEEKFASFIGNQIQEAPMLQEK